MTRSARISFALLVPIGLLAGLLSGSRAEAGVQPTGIFLFLQGVQGEAQEPYENMIEVLHFSWGVSNSAAGAAGGGSAGEKVIFTDFDITKLLDRSSPRLMKLTASGQKIPTGKLIVVEGNEGVSEFLVYCFEDLVISKIQTSGSDGGEVHEEVKIDYTRMVERYNYQQPDGPTIPIFAGWDRKADKAFGPAGCADQ